MFTTEAMTYLWKMGRGEIKGYDVSGMQDTMREVMFRSEELAPKALEIAARNPDRRTQEWLESVIFDPAARKAEDAGHHRGCTSTFRRTACSSARRRLPT